MGYRLNRLDEPVFIAVSKPLLTEFDIHQRLESCERILLSFVPSSNFLLYVSEGLSESRRHHLHSIMPPDTLPL